MAEDEDDYLSDKFLAELAASTSSTSSAAKTYSDRRKEAEKRAQIKNAENRIKGRRQRELESRQEGLRQSLFARAKEEESSGLPENKALNIMMKMGFQPGQSLGPADPEIPASLPPLESEGPSFASSPPEPSVKQKKNEPLPINEWEGRTGIGLRKRPPSPSAAERVAKMAKLEDNSAKLDFRDRSRLAYLERRAEGQLGPAQRTCAALDEKDGKKFNVLWLNPSTPESYPAGLHDALSRISIASSSEPIEHRLRRQMQAERLQPLGDDREEDPSEKREDDLPMEIIKESAQFLRLQAQDRLGLVLSYLRDRYSYCFWCGTQYEDEEDMATNCPGLLEDDHD